MAQRGRPRSQYLPRFNVATDLIENKRFLRFKRALGVDLQTAWILITRFFCFVAAHHSDNGSIAGEDPETIAEFCFWSGPADQLLAALGPDASGFVEQDGEVHDWFDNQPWAEYRRTERMRKADISTGKMPDEGVIPPEKSADGQFSAGKRDKAISLKAEREERKERSSPPSPPSNGGHVENSDERPERGSTNQPRSPTDLATDLANAKRVNGRQTESKSSTVVHLTDELCGILGVRETQDRTTIFVHVSRAVANVGDQPVWGVIGDVKLGVRERRFKNPIGVAISELKKLAPSGNGTGQVYAPG